MCDHHTADGGVGKRVGDRAAAAGGVDVVERVDDRREVGLQGAELLDDGGFGWVETSQADAEAGVRSGRYDAALIPIAAIRQPDGLRFAVQVGEPVPPGEPEAMMQALNDDLERLVRTHMDQWFWVHRRWK